MNAFAKKFLIRRFIGEVYVGKRMKMHYFNQLLPFLTGAIGTEPRVLEVGSEDGCFTEWLSRKWPGGQVEGMELRESWAGACAEWARGAGRSPQLTFRQGNVMEMTDEGLYDMVVSFDVLGYIVDDHEAVRRMSNALNPGGLLLIHQPNTSYRCFNGVVHYVPPEKAGAITEGNVRHGYTPEELKSLLTRSGMNVSRVYSIHGRFSDLAHRVYNCVEYPAILRFLSVPFTDLLWFLDWHFPTSHGNTVLAASIKPATLEAIPPPE